jgi:hypothetical protein
MIEKYITYEIVLEIKVIYLYMYFMHMKFV